MFFYWALSNYGRSFLLSAAWLALSVWLFHFGYAWILAPLMPQAGTLDAAKYAHAVCMVAVGNAVPFVGPLTIDAEIKKFLFCPGFGPCLPISPEGFQFLVIAQNIFSITCVFFIGLALRTANIDYNGRFCTASAAARLKMDIGRPPVDLIGATEPAFIRLIQRLWRIHLHG